MIKQTKQVEEFNKAFNIHVAKEPTLIPPAETQLRYALMLEELQEYKEACDNGDLVEVADALTDLKYVLSGMFIRHGMQFIEEPLFDEVHSSNMSKLDDHGKPIYRNDGKVLKSENYFKPNLEPIVYGNVENKEQRTEKTK